jgi:hypothetical protein
VQQVCLLVVLCVCRVRDTCIIVAVDEPPEEGLEQPLRLEKLANEVRQQQQQQQPYWMPQQPAHAGSTSSTSSSSSRQCVTLAQPSLLHWSN